MKKTYGLQNWRWKIVDFVQKNSENQQFYTGKFDWNNQFQVDGNIFSPKLTISPRKNRLKFKFIMKIFHFHRGNGEFSINCLFFTGKKLREITIYTQISLFLTIYCNFSCYFIILTRSCVNFIMADVSVINSVMRPG